jgi:hypothetical protein
MGPAACGAVLGLPAGPAKVAVLAVVVPAAVLGLAVLMVPALYVGATLAGVAPPARQVVKAAGDAITGCGIALLGLVPPTGFVVATANRSRGIWVVGLVVIGAAVIVGLARLYRELFGEPARRAPFLFGTWALVALGLGARLFVEVLP